ncbi:MAG: 50S ribosomal protein L11 methyltransferase [Gammaproteobacteria bacterium]|nr:50S ribosomal protein L11 methyltransferase [Gammaproteobacteria bacterium]
MPWLQISIETTEEQAPFLELVLQNLGALSVTLDDAADQAVLEPRPGEQKIWQSTRVSGLFTADTDADELRSILNQTLQADIARTLKCARIEDRIWERVWLDDFHPMKFGRRLWICPHETAPDETDAVIVQLDPGLAFGTGTHPTTALCLEWLDGCDLKGKTVLDYGCGSGILAIAALRLGARLAIAVDYDTQAIQASRINAEKNRVSERLSTYTPDQLPPLTADLLVANILAGPLIDLAPRLCSLLVLHGRFALSGILEDQGPEVSTAYAECAELAPPTRREDWLLLSGTRV